MARVSVFRCDTDPELYGYTAGDTRESLLRARRDLKWTYLRESEVFPADGHSAVDVADMLHDLGQKGYYLFSTNPRSATYAAGKAKTGDTMVSRNAYVKMERGSVSLSSVGDRLAEPLARRSHWAPPARPTAH
jgi:hypothetical protein